MSRYFGRHRKSSERHPKRRVRYRQILMENLESRQLMAVDTSPMPLFRSLPPESTSDELVSMQLLQTANGSSKPLTGGVSHDEVYSGNAGYDWEQLKNPAIDIAADAVSLAGSFQNRVKNSSFDPDRNIRATSSMNNEILYGGNKADSLTLNHDRGYVMAGGGNDRAELNAPFGVAMMNRGDDFVGFKSHSGIAMGGPGNDTFRLSVSSTDNLIIDSSPKNWIEYDGRLADVGFQWSGKKLGITKDGKVLASIQNPDFGIQEFILKTKDGQVPLSTLQRIPDRDAAVLAIAAYQNNRDAYQPILKMRGYTELSRTVNPTTGLEMTILNRDFVPPMVGSVQTDPVAIQGQIVAGIAGTQDSVDFKTFALSPQNQALEIEARIEAIIKESQISVVTIVGHSGGGEVALRAARSLAEKYPGIQFNVVMLNSGGVSPFNVDSYRLDNLGITHYRYETDFLSNSKMNELRGGLLGGEKFVYPEQTQTITVPFDGSGPEFHKDPAGWFNHNHAAERILDHLGKTPSGTLVPQSQNSTHRFSLSASSNPMPQQEIDLSELPDGVMDAIQSMTESLQKMDLDLPVVPDFYRSFDFGSSSFNQPGTVNVPSDLIYSPSIGYGFKEGAPIRSGDNAIGNDWQRDYVVASSIPFKIDLEPGFYLLTLMTGNASGLDYLNVYANSQSIGMVANTSPRQIKETTLRVYHPGGTLDLEIRDTGGRSEDAILNGLKIKRVAAWMHPPIERTSDPSLTIIVPGYSEPVSLFDKIEASIEPIIKIAESVALLVTPAAPLKAIEVVKSALAIASSSSKLYKTWSSGKSDLPEWVYTQQIASNHQNALVGLPLQRFATDPISLTKLESMTNQEQQKLLRNADVIIIDAQKQLNNGVKPYGAFGDRVNNTNDYRESIDRLSAQIYRTIRNKGQAIGLEASQFQLDVQLIAEDFAFVAAREALDRISQEGKSLSEKLGYVELVALNPIAVVKTDDPWIQDPETRPFSLFVRNFYESVTDVPSDFYKGPLDKIDGGNHLGVEAGIAREFSAADPLGTTRYKNFSKEGKRLSGQIERIDFHNHGLFAYSNTFGYVSVVNSNREALLFQDRIFEDKPIELKFSPDGKRLAALGDQGNLAIINLQNRAIQRSVLSQGFDVGLSWLDDNRVVLVGKGGLTQRISISLDGKISSPTSMGRIGQDVLDFWIAPMTDGKSIRVFTTHEDRSVQVWSLSTSGTTPVMANRLTLGTNKTVLDIDTLRGNILVSNGSNVELLHVDGNQLSQKISIQDLAKGSKVTAGRLSEDGSRIVTGGDDKQIRVYDALDAFGGVRTLVTNYASVMPVVRSIEISDNADQVFVAYNDTQGGKTIDWNLAGDLREKMGLISRIRASEFDQAKMLPFIVMENYADQLQFHFRRNIDELDALYGQEAKQTSWKFARPATLDEIYKDEDFMGEIDSDNLPPAFVRKLEDMSLGESQIVDLVNLAFDPEGQSIQYRVRSSNPSIAKANISAGRLLIEPVDEGTSKITLTASDGKSWSAIEFKVTTDTTLQRQQFSQIQDEFTRIVMEQEKVSMFNKTFNRTIKALRNAIEELEEDVRDYEKKLSFLSNKTQDLSTTLGKIRSAITASIQERSSASNSLSQARIAHELSKRQADEASDNLDAANQLLEERQRVFSRAQNRLENAKPSQREARRSELQAAKTALDSAIVQRNSIRQIAHAAESQLKKDAKAREDAQERLSKIDDHRRRLNKDLEDTLNDQVDVQKLLNQHLLKRPALTKSQDALLKRLANEQDAVVNNASKGRELTSRMQELEKTFQDLKQSKWVDNLGITVWESDFLKPNRNKLPGIAERSSSNLEIFDRLTNRLKSLLD